MPFARLHQPVVRHAVVASVRPIPQPAGQFFIHHVVFDPAQEIDGAFVAATFPVVEINPGLVMDQQHPPAFGHTLTQSPGRDALERAHVMLMQILPDRQMPQRVRAQIQTVEMSHRLFASLMPHVMRGRLVPVPVGGETVVTRQFRNRGEPVGQCAISGGDQRVVRHPQHLAPTLTVQRGKIVGCTGNVLETRAVFLEKGATTGGKFEHALNAQLKKVCIGKFGAVSGVIPRDEQAGQRFKERGVHRGGRMSNKH